MRGGLLKVSIFLAGDVTEAAFQQGVSQRFYQTVKEFGADAVEISSAQVVMSLEDKCQLIRMAQDAGLKAVAEAGQKGHEDWTRSQAYVFRQIEAYQKAGAEHKHPKHFLFFSPSPQSQKAADAFLQRLGERQADRDTAVSDQTVQAQLTAIAKWGQAPNSSETLKQVQHPVLIANGDADVMVPTPNSIALFEALPNAKLSIFPDASHGGIFQYADAFVDQALRFLAE